MYAKPHRHAAIAKETVEALPRRLEQATDPVAQAGCRALPPKVSSVLPRRQTRVLTWPLVTVWGFIAQPETHIFLKPNVTRIAAKQYEYDFQYASRPSWDTYQSLRGFAEQVRRDTRDLNPRDMIDLQ